MTSKTTRKLCPYCQSKITVGPSGRIYKHRGYETKTEGICDGWGQKYETAVQDARKQFLGLSS